MTPLQLSQWLEPMAHETSLSIAGRNYRLLSQFRIAFFIHCVFYDTLSKKYIWFIVENHVLYEERFRRAKRYDSYREMIDDVAAHFTMYPVPSLGQVSLAT